MPDLDLKFEITLKGSTEGGPMRAAIKMPTGVVKEYESVEFSQNTKHVRMGQAIIATGEESLTFILKNGPKIHIPEGEQGA